MEAPRRIDDEDVAATGNGGLAGIVGDRCRVAAFLVLHELGSATLRPCFELVDGRGTERIAGGNHHLLALANPTGRELADGGRLAGAVHADDKHHVRFALEFERWRIFEEAFGLVAHDVEHLLRRKRLAEGVLTEGVRQKERSLNAHVSLDQMFFELFQGVVGNLTCTDNALEFAHQGVTGLGQSLLYRRKQSH